MTYLSNIASFTINIRRTIVGSKPITLPNRDEMLKRLVKVEDNRHIQDNLFPRFLAKAGEEKIAEGIVYMISTAISEYTKDLPVGMANFMQFDVPKYIGALVDDEQVAKKANKFFETIMNKIEGD